MYNFGEKIGEAEVSGETVDIFCNKGYENGPSPFFTEDKEGNFLGIKYHCVELVRRFLYQKTKKNLAQTWQEGHASDWWENADVMEAEKISGEHLVETKDFLSLRTGDIICFSGGKYGHVGIISEILTPKKQITFCHQNFFADDRDVKTLFTPQKKHLKKDNGETYTLQGFLRFF